MTSQKIPAPIGQGSPKPSNLLKQHTPNMKGILSKIFFLLFLITAVTSVFFTVFPLENGGPCSCLGISYGIGSVIKTAVELQALK